MRRLKKLSAILGALVLGTLTLAGEGTGSEPTARLHIITTDFVLPSKFTSLRKQAEESKLAFEVFYVKESDGTPKDWLSEADLAILDTPRPGDRSGVEQVLGSALETRDTPWLRIGGGPPEARNLAPEHARAMGQYYAHGGLDNIQHLFAYIAHWQAGTDVTDIPAAKTLPEAGFYHPEAPHPFANLEDYLEWGDTRWSAEAPRLGLVMHQSSISDMETGVVDALIQEAETAGLVPLAFWFDASDPNGLGDIVNPANVDVLANLTHMQNGEARKAEFLELDIPVIQTVSYRDGTISGWLEQTSGTSSRIVAPFLSVPEAWGMSDPIVISAVEEGAQVPIPEQVDLLVAKAERLSRLRHTANADKRLALMFWNYPPGEANLSASHLNVPRSLESLIQALAEAGYSVPLQGEDELIAGSQALLEALHQPEKLEQLLSEGRAGTLAVSQYREWLQQLPDSKRDEMLENWGEPSRHWAVHEIDGKEHFIIPRLALGNLAVLPQMPRGGDSTAEYHGGDLPPDHLYMAAYLFLRKEFAADALIHFGTHGTQEWLPGKDRGLSAHDFPFLALGDLPVFYPYIQDNVAEAVQAKRRGRAVTISHQTPPFAPAGLYDELRDIHALIHEYEQLNEGSVRESTKEAIQAEAVAADMHQDLQWQEEEIEKDFAGFLRDLHNHLHQMAQSAMPLGLHTFGRPASPEHRLATVMQQLGDPFYQLVDSEPNELFLEDFSQLRESAPYRTLNRYLREEVDVAETNSESLQEMMARAAALDANLAEPGETEALLAALEGRFVAPGSGGDPIRNPEVKSGRNLYAFEPDKIPTRAAYEAGLDSFEGLLTAFRNDNQGEFPQKLAFSLWSSEAVRHLGVTEAQVLHALGLRPEWDEGGRIEDLKIIPEEELDRPRIDVVIQVTSVYRDQFDGFMRMLADAIAEVSQLENETNVIVRNSGLIARQLEKEGISPSKAEQLSYLRIFGNAPGDYGTGLPDLTLDSTSWEEDAPLAEAFLGRMQYAYGSGDYDSGNWGVRLEKTNLFTKQLSGSDAAIMSRSSNLHGMLSTDHPFEFLGGLSLALRHIDGESPNLYISDLRRPQARVTGADRFISEELRSRYLNPQWIQEMQDEGYAGTLQVLGSVNNLWGWQVMDPQMVRADQWQSVHETFVEDARELGVNEWFETHNPMAQAQVIERLIEAIRKGYWEASEETRQALSTRWQALAEEHDATVGAEMTKTFAKEMTSGFGMSQAEVPEDAEGAQPSLSEARPSESGARSREQEPVEGRLLEPAEATPERETSPWTLWASLGFFSLLLIAGAGAQWRTNDHFLRTE